MYDIKAQSQALAALRSHAGYGKDVVVAVLDGAVNTAHPELQETKINDAQVHQKTLHGTAVATLISSAKTGIAPQARVIQIPVFHETSEGQLKGCSQFVLARAVQAACDQGAHIINISGANLSNTGQPEDAMRDAIDRCVRENIQVVAAVGNDGLAVDTVPACIPHVLAIGAHDINGQTAAFNNTGPKLRHKTIFAPGVDIHFTQDDQITEISGSSFATPIVSGLCALIRKSSPKISLGDLQDILFRSCVLGTSSLPSGANLPAERRLDFVLLHENLSPFWTDQMIPQHYILERNTPMSDIDTTPETCTPAGDMTPVDAVFAEAEVTPAEVQETVVAPAEAPALQAAPAAPAAMQPMRPFVQDAPSGQFVHLGQDTVRPQQVASNTLAENKVFAFGKIGFDFLNETNRDYFQQAMFSLGEQNPNLKPLLPENELSMARFLSFRDASGNQPNMDSATALTWTLKVDGIPIYAIQPQNQFAVFEFGRLLDFLIGQTGIEPQKFHDPEAATPDMLSAQSGESDFENKIDRVSIAGHIVGETRLYNGHVVPVISPILRGMFSWNAEMLCAAVLGKTPKPAEKDGLRNFLDRIYYDLRNRGVEPHHRAMNFAATNAHQAGEVFKDAATNKLELDEITVERSPVSRPGSEFYDVVLSFFNPLKRDREARKFYRYTIDVCGIMPVTFGPLRSWHAY